MWISDAIFAARGKLPSRQAALGQCIERSVAETRAGKLTTDPEKSTCRQRGNDV
jgi:hypothetical protein